MDIQPHQEWTRAEQESGYGKFLAAGVAETLWHDNKPIACYGGVVLWPGNGEVWAILSRGIGTAMTAVVRAFRALIEDSVPRRLQAYVDADFEPGIRLMFQLGFQVEGKARAYLANGHDAFLFARLADDAQPLAVVDTYGDMPALAKIMRLESEMAVLPQLDIEPVHHFSKGIYAREIIIPAGALIAGKMHATDHLNILSKGEISVLTENGIERLRAPAVIPARAGMKRVGYAHEETVWTTIHGTDETDLAKLEAELIIPAAALEVLP
ncbi:MULTISPECIES: hypothetical protein [unclassified Achromobacter]|uniref:hypothetical protein n=1 Tax=unclassified Achromobacter TaxID=2626865 RepID=UPI0011773BE4|nr:MULTISPECIES: hypothetical protein [unclassified Achromobacter]